ncbi:MAG: hypothetical protein JNJ73_04830 [Hyphomonadaceae bacterium]|nr:hypothetical protein [Hyphomonadaceae bacterium]
MNWLRTSPTEEFISSLEFAAKCSETVTSDAASWRWLVLSLHLAAQGALVCALKGHDTSGVSALSGPSAKQTQRWIEERIGPAPNQQLASFRELLSRARTEAILPYPHTVSLGTDVINDVLRLTEVRNQFAHLAVDGWSLDLSGLPRMVLHTVDLIEHLAIVAPTFDHWYEAGAVERIASAIKHIRHSLHIVSTPAEASV